jgi:excisionase family DNA binding protein
MEELYTILEVTDWLKLPQHTVKRWLVSGQLRGLKAGRKWCMKPSAIEQFLQASKDMRDNARLKEGGADESAPSTRTV